MSNLAFRARNLLDSGEISPEDFRNNGGVIELGRQYTPPAVDGSETETAETVERRKPISRAARERLPGKLAAQVMDHYMSHEALNDPHNMNPIRDGIPQCRRHPFDRSRGLYGCIHGCASSKPEDVLPPTRDHTVYDVFKWAEALVAKAVKTTELQKGWRRPVDLTGKTKR